MKKLSAIMEFYESAVQVWYNVEQGFLKVVNGMLPIWRPIFSNSIVVGCLHVVANRCEANCDTWRAEPN